MLWLVVILALALCLLFWALYEALSHLWRMCLRQRFFPAIEEYARPASPSSSTTASSPAPETPQDLEKGVTSLETPPVQPESIDAPPRIKGDVESTGRPPSTYLKETSLLAVPTGPKIFSVGPVAVEDFVIPPRRRTSDDGDVIPTPPPSGLFIANPSPTETGDVAEHFEDVGLNSISGPSAHQLS